MCGNEKTIFGAISKKNVIYFPKDQSQLAAVLDRVAAYEKGEYSFTVRSSSFSLGGNKYRKGKNYALKEAVDVVRGNDTAPLEKHAPMEGSIKIDMEMMLGRGEMRLRKNFVRSHVEKSEKKRVKKKRKNRATDTTMESVTKKANTNGKEVMESVVLLPVVGEYDDQIDVDTETEE